MSRRKHSSSLPQKTLGLMGIFLLTATGFFLAQTQVNLSASVTQCTTPIIVAGRAWQNQSNPLDVNKDGSVTDVDANVIIDDLRINNARALPSTNTSSPQIYLDVNGDGNVTNLDAFLVTGYLRCSPPTSSLPTTPAPQCRPGESKKEGCNNCYCNGNGVFICTRNFCPVAKPECSDGKDNDKDGKTDFRVACPICKRGVKECGSCKVFGDAQCQNPEDASESR